MDQIQFNGSNSLSKKEIHYSILLPDIFSKKLNIKHLKISAQKIILSSYMAFRATISIVSVGFPVACFARVYDKMFGFCEYAIDDYSE